MTFKIEHPVVSAKCDYRLFDTSDAFTTLSNAHCISSLYKKSSNLVRTSMNDNYIH